MIRYFIYFILFVCFALASNTHAAAPAIKSDVKQAIEETESFLPPLAVEVTSTDINPAAELRALAEATPELEIDVVQTRTARALMAGHGRELKTKVIEMLTRLGIKGDPTKIRVTVDASPVVNATIRTVDGIAEVHISAGLIGLVRNEDEFAFILGHELTHGNPGLFKLPKDPTRVKEILSKLPSSLGHAHIEELRADLGSIHRLISAGYNPWGGYDAMKRIAALQAQSGEMNYTDNERRMANLKAFVSSHPDSELRMSAMKSYVTLRQQSENLSQVLSTKSEFSGGMKALHLKMLTYQSIANPYFRRSYINRPLKYLAAVAASDALLTLFMSPESAQLAAILSASANAIGPYAASAWELLSQAPDGTIKLIQILKEMPAEKAAQVVALLASSTAGLKWGHSKYRQSKEDKLVEKVRAVLSKHYPVLKLAESRVPRVIALQRELGRKGVFDRTNSLVSALQLNAKVLASFEQAENFAYYARDAGFPADLIQARIIQPMREEAVARQILLHTLVEEFLPRIPNAQMAEITRQIEKIPQNILLGPELRGSVESLASSSRNHFPNFRFSSAIERALLAQSRAQNSISRAAVESTTESLDSIMLKTEELMRGIARTLPPEKPKAGTLPRMKPLKVHEQGVEGHALKKLFQMSEPYVEQWLAAAAEPGARGEHAADLFKRTHTTLVGSRDVLTSDEVRRFQSRTITALAENRGAPPKLRIMDIERTLAFPPTNSDKERAAFQKTRDAINPYTKFWESLEKFKSVKELDAYVQSEFIERQGMKMTDWPFKDLYKWIEKRPGLLQTKEDIDLLLNRAYYWNTMGTGDARLDRALVHSLKSSMQANGKLWEFRPEYSEKLQKRILEKMSSLGLMPTDRSGDLVLWQRFVGRGVTNTTDQMFGKLFESADPNEQFRLSGLTKGRLWEPQLRAKALKVRLDRTKEMKLLVETANELRPSRELRLERVKALREVTRITENEFSGRGPEYNSMIEKVADQAKTSQFEERFLDRYRGPTGVGQADVTTRTLSSLSEAVQRLPKDEKWQMILWLRGERPASKAVEELFPVVGSDRVQRMYSLLPEYQKAVFLDNILDSSTGLMPKGSVKDGWGKTIVDYLVGGGKTGSKEAEKSRTIAREILEAYLGSFDGGTGNKAQRTLVLSYMLASKGGDGSNGRVLKQVLEAMGASGVKIGQFIVAADILPESDNATLRTLQDQANKPKRSRMYADISKAMHGEPVPGKLDDLLGAASVKYAAKALDLDDGHPFVLKVLRAEASATVDQQFDRLNGMADILKKQHGSKYSVLRSIIRASREAIHRELKLDNEVRNSADATREVYSKLSDFEVPKEKLVDATMIKSEFADGTSIHDLMPEAQGHAALRIMQIEGDNLFADQDVITFDPDRHPGNFKIQAEAQTGKLTFRPIDFGQVLQITRAQRDRVIDLFAISGIMDRYGSTDWASKLVLEKLDLPAAKSTALRKLLAKSYPATNRSPLASYYSLLSALEEIGHPMPIQFFDFARAVVQHNQYLGVIKENAPQLMTAEFKSPRDRLTTLATARAEEFGKNVNLSTGDKVRYVVKSGVDIVKAGVAKGFSCVESFGKIIKPADAL